MPARRAWTTLGSAELRKEAIPLPTGDHVIYAVAVLRLAQAQVRGTNPMVVFWVQAAGRRTDDKSNGSDKHPSGVA
jgi:predicted 2-oxoglutarate/Fe(II)-dependent dioxygenase YbiX